MSQFLARCRILTALISLTAAAAGSGNIDNELWLSVEVEHQLAQRLNAGLEQEIRRDEDYTEQKSSLTSLSLAYKLNSRLKIITNYRYASYEDQSRQRLSGGFVILAGDSWSFDNRLRYQVDFSEDDDPAALFRNRLRLTFKGFRKIRPYLAVEGFLPVADRLELDEYRLTGGLGYKLNRQLSIKLFYHLKIEDLKKEYQDRINVLGINLGYDI